ncbi:MAG: serine/threonine protein kinase [Myxococcales bacterium]|nr:serine/threonine protein kinase [Myxococcales bacterium]
MARKCPHCGAQHDALRCTATGLPVGGDPSLVGTTLAGRYHLVRLLGDGGMGAVYKAADPVLRRFVAIKLLHAATARNSSAVQRFVREARSSAAIGHPNIIDVLDFGEAGTRPYLVMEYLRGRSLSHAIATDGPFAIERACRIATHTLAGLAAAHDKGILHRDLKPANMMLVVRLGDPDFVKLCDFGFAALVTPTERIDDAKVLTPARTLVGTPAYAAPERLRGEEHRDPRIDIYSLGVVLFEMLAGRRPFEAPGFRELARKIRKDPPPSVRLLRSDIPVGLARIISRALAKDPAERWDQAEELAAALVPYGGRVVPDLREHPSDTFTMDLLRLKARETQRQRSLDPAEAAAILRGSSPARATFGDTQESEALEVSVELPTGLGSRPGGGPASQRSTDEPSSTLRRGDRLSPPPAPSSDDLRPTAWRPPEELEAPNLSALSPGLSDDAGEFSNTTLQGELAARAEPSMLGATMVALLEDLRSRFGPNALGEVLDRLSPASASSFQRGVDDRSWVPYSAVCEFLERVDSTLGDDDLQIVAQCGRAAAVGAIRAIERERGLSDAPEVLLSDLPAISALLFDGLELRMIRLGRGYGRVELLEQGESSLAGCVAILGFLDTILVRVGASEVEVNLLCSVALGDPQTFYEISWLS